MDPKKWYLLLKCLDKKWPLSCSGKKWEEKIVRGSKLCRKWRAWPFSNLQYLSKGTSQAQYTDRIIYICSPTWHYMLVSIISEGITFPGQHTWTQVLPADRACHDSGEGAPCRTHLCQQVSVINIQLLKSTWSVRWSVRVDIFIHHGRHCLCVEKSEHGGFNGWIEMGSKPPEPRNQYDFFQNLRFALRKQISA